MNKELPKVLEELSKINEEKSYVSFQDVALKVKEYGLTPKDVKVLYKDLNEHNVVNTLLKPNGFKSRIYCQETNQIFETLNEAAAFCNKTNQSVMKNCQGKTKQCGGYHFNYLSDLSEEKILQIYGYNSTFFERHQGDMEEDND